MNEPRVYKTSPILLVMIVVLFVFLLGVLVFAFGPNPIGFMVPLVLFSLFLFGAIFVVLTSKTVISDDEITVQNLLGTKTLRWTEIGRASGSGYSIKLHSNNEDVTLAVSPRLPGYEQIIDFIGTKRPDLFSPQDYSEMRRGVVPYLGMVLFVLFMAGVAITFIFATLGDPDVTPSTYMPLFFIVAVVLFLVVTTLSVPRSLTLEGRTINLKYLFSEKTLNVDEIAFIQFGFTQSRNGKHYFIDLHLTDRKKIRITGLGTSLPIAYLVLKNWHMKYVQGRSQFGSVAPNWSDNS